VGCAWVGSVLWPLLLVYSVCIRGALRCFLIKFALIKKKKFFFFYLYIYIYIFLFLTSLNLWSFVLLFAFSEAFLCIHHVGLRPSAFFNEMNYLLKKKVFFVEALLCSCLFTFANFGKI
jgi:hypothetical protein